jgi:hypothetical protein
MQDHRTGLGDVWSHSTPLRVPFELSEGVHCRPAKAFLLSLNCICIMSRIIHKPVPKLQKTPQPPLSRAGATPDSDRARKPPLSEPAATSRGLIPGDRVERLGDFGKPTGEFGMVERTNDDDAVVKWDDDGRKRLPQSSLRKI